MSRIQEIQFYHDVQTVELLLSDTSMLKQASVMSGIVDKAKTYIGNQIDPNDKAGSLLNILVPGALSVAIGGWLGPLFGLSMRVLDIDISGILKSIYDSIKSLITGERPVTSTQVDDIVESSVQSVTGEKPVLAFDTQEVMLLKLATINYHQGTWNQDQLAVFAAGGRRSKATGILAKVLKVIFKVALSAAGLMVAGDAVNKFLGRPNALDGSIQQGRPVMAPPSVSTSIQKVFPVNPSYHNKTYNQATSWIENYPNSKSGIEQMLIDFAQEVYGGLEGKESQIKASPAFQVVVNHIAFANLAAVGDPFVFIPKHFASKKQIVDDFIDQVASTSKSVTPNPTTHTPVAPGHVFSSAREHKVDFLDYYTNLISLAGRKDDVLTKYPHLQADLEQLIAQDPSGNLKYLN